MIDPEDAMIAGIALLSNETILTKNVEHFSRIRNLKIETYWTSCELDAKIKTKVIGEKYDRGIKREIGGDEIAEIDKKIEEVFGWL